MKFTNWLLRKPNLPLRIEFGSGTSACILLLFGIAILAPLAPAQPRLEIISTIQAPFDGFTPQYPVALAINPADSLYVLDAQLATIVELTQDGRLLNQVGGPGTGIEQFADPSDFCAVSGLDVFVADRGNDRIVRLDRKLNYLAEFRSLSGTPTDLTFENPRSVLLGPRGDLFIADGGNDRILKIDPMGGPIFSFGEYGQGKNSLLEPRRLELDPNGGLWVLDVGGHVIRFDEYGGYLNHVLAQIAGRPTGLAVSSNAVWVCSDSLLWHYDRSTRNTTTFRPDQIGISAGAALVDIAFRKEQLWLLNSAATIYRFQVCHRP